MARKPKQFWKWHNMESDVVWNAVLPEYFFRLRSVCYAFICNYNINLVLGSSQLSDDVGSMLLHPAYNKRVNSVSYKKNIQGHANLAKIN